MNNDIRRDADQNNKQLNKIRIVYRKFKTIENLKCEDYPRQVTNTPHRITSTKLWLSNNKLTTEAGRFLRPHKKPEEKICPICKLETEGKYHFLTVCPAYQEKRNVLSDNLKNKHLTWVNKMSPYNSWFMFFFLINPPNEKPETQKLKAKHVFECVKIRWKEKEFEDKK